MKIKSQSSIEFILLACLSFFFLVIFLSIIQDNLELKEARYKDILIEETALAVQNEIALAQESSDGYTREFEVPQKIESTNYTIIIESNRVYVSTLDKKHSIALPIPSIQGNVIKGTNLIQKKQGKIYLNS